MINFSDVNFSYSTRNSIFEQLDLDLDKGNIYGLLGRNGAGKTTLLRLMSGLLFPKSGDIEVMGYTPSKRQPEFLEDVFFISEELFIPRMKVVDYVAAQARFYPKFDYLVFDKNLNAFGVDENQLLTSLSYGQKKKVLLSFGIATNSSLLILDEPTNGLDIPSKSQFRKVLAEAATEDRTVIISTHQVRDLSSLMDPIIILDGGKVVLQKSVEEISKKIQFKLVQAINPPAGVLYSEQVPGGYLVLEENIDGNYTDVNIEALFNAIVGHKKEVLHLLS